MAHCEHTHELQAYHDGEASPKQAEKLEEHLAGCPVCAEELGQLQSLSQRLRELRQVEMAAGVLERLEQRVSSGYTADASLARIAGWLTAAAAALLIAGTLMLLWHRGGTDVGYPSAEIALDSITANQTFDELDVTDPDPEVEIAFWIVDQLASTNGGY